MHQRVDMCCGVSRSLEGLVVARGRTVAAGVVRRSI